jgi:hypothetical protein
MLLGSAIPLSARWVFYREPDMFLFLPLENDDPVRFENAVKNAVSEGGVWLGTIVLANKQVEGEPVFGYELAPGAPEEAMQRAKLRYRDNLIEAGVLMVGGAAQC